MITVSQRPTHVSEVDALACAEAFIDSGSLISDDVAATIASWWQSADSLGMPFTKVSQGNPVELFDLVDSIYIEAQSVHILSPHRHALLALMAWAWTTDDHVV